MSSFGKSTHTAPLSYCIRDRALLQDTAFAASVHQFRQLSSGRAATAFLPKFCSQLASDLDFWESQVWWNESWCHPLQKANCLVRLVCRSTVLAEDKNSSEIWRVTGSSCSVSSTPRQYVPLVLTPGSTNVRFIFPNLDMPTNIISNLLKVKCSKKFTWQWQWHA